MGSRDVGSKAGSQTSRASGRVYRRWPTREVRIGDVGVGGDNPIRVQSMTTPATTDTAATVEQIERLVDAGCEIVRVTVPTSADADNLPNIRRELRSRGIEVPLVADIHFTPAAALKAAEHVDKVRINPGNYADKKKFDVREYTDDEYRAELDRIEKIFVPLVKRCAELGVAMRIGTNHGSLSDRIMNRYGDSPEGMVESALEFVRICEAHDYHEIILSMKASNPVVVLQAYRLLVDRMVSEGMAYPLHLGVTEAGDGEDARIKSAIGIGALLEEGIGDTVRVSLTEDPVAEIPVARALVAPFNELLGDVREKDAGPEGVAAFVEYERRRSGAATVGPRTFGYGHPVVVEVPLRSALEDGDAVRAELDAQSGARVPEDTRAELVSVGVASDADLGPLEELRRSMELVAPNVALSARLDLDLTTLDDDALRRAGEAAHRLHVPLSGLNGIDRVLEATGTKTALLCEVDPYGDSVRAPEIARRAIAKGRGILFAVDPATGLSPLHSTRRLAAVLAEAGLDTPIVLLDRARERGADTLLGPSSVLGGLLCEGIGDAIHVEAATALDSRRIAFGILQAARVRITRTEFISCPSCGRTLFDLEETTARIKRRTAHLKGVKIAVMGCIVNGPGEMADADFGYVGWGEDKIALFVGKEMVAKDIPTGESDDRLVELIKEHGRWIDPPPSDA
jgi:(E)-4-hydroxy-3-methylbut-2-enyl-diphosphate synthase